MTVGELIEKLNEYPRDMVVLQPYSKYSEYHTSPDFFWVSGAHIDEYEIEVVDADDFREELEYDGSLSEDEIEETMEDWLKNYQKVLIIS